MPLIHKFTLEDAVNSEEHVELIDGQLVVQDKTSYEHNNVLGEIEASFRSFIKENGGGCIVARENVAIYCDEITGDTDRNFVLPDLMVICDNREQMKSDGLHAAPDFVMEVISPSTRHIDYNEKKNIYEQIGVKEYWIVDIDKKCLSIYTREGEYDPPSILLHPQIVPVQIYEGKLQIDFTGLI